MRCGYPLRYFSTGETKSYVFSDGKNITDYADDYEDNKSFCELIGNFVERATGDEKYAFKIVKILAKKMKVDNSLLSETKNLRIWCKELELNNKRNLRRNIVFRRKGKNDLC